jgi:hypothetical protein
VLGKDWGGPQATSDHDHSFIIQTRGTHLKQGMWEEHRSLAEFET